MLNIFLNTWYWQNIKAHTEWSLESRQEEEEEEEEEAEESLTEIRRGLNVCWLVYHMIIGSFAYISAILSW